MGGWDENGADVILYFLWKENRPVESSHGAIIFEGITKGGSRRKRQTPRPR